MIITKIKQNLYKERLPNGDIRFVGGLLPQVKDTRDFRYKDLMGFSLFDYTPKHDYWKLKTLSVKDQVNLNTCVFNSYAVQREPDEGCELSVKSLVQYAAKNKMLSGNGFSTLRNGQKIGQEFGICDNDVCPNIVTDWTSYALRGMTQQQIDNASTHKSKSYFLVDSEKETLKALDDGYIIHTGLTWYNSYNMTGGLKAPWVLPFEQGRAVGGHAVALKGYNYKKRLLIFQNSFGASWGDNGDFYVRMDDWFKYSPEGYACVDMDADSWKKFIASHEGRDVKGKGAAIYRIMNGKKCIFNDPLCFFAYGGSFEPSSFDLVSDTLLNKTPLGETMQITKSPYWSKLVGSWSAISRMSYPQNYQMIQTLLSK
jgi:hypothetical protein